MKRFGWVGLLVCFAWGCPAQALGAELSDLEKIMEGLLTRHDYPLKVELRVHPEASLGIAAIVFEADRAQVSVHPDRLRDWSLNTWTFVLGHELGHQLHQHTPDSKALDPEFEADITGALLARAAGGDLETFVRELYGREGCGPTHGCLSERARRLELYFALDLGLWTEGHQRETEFNAIVGPLSDAPPHIVHALLVKLREWTSLGSEEKAAKLAEADLPPRQQRSAAAWLELPQAERDEAEREIMVLSQRAFASQAVRNARRHEEPEGGLPAEGPVLPTGNAEAAPADGVLLPGAKGALCCSGTSTELTAEREALLIRLYGPKATPEIRSTAGLAGGVSGETAKPGGSGD